MTGSGGAPESRLRLPGSVRALWASYRPATFAPDVMAWRADRRARDSYQTVSAEDLRRVRRSETVFVCGTGGSLLEIDDRSWERIAAHDVIGFSEFSRQRWVRVDLHVVAEIADIDAYARLLTESPHYRETILVIQEGRPARYANNLVGRRLLPAGARVFRFRRISRGTYADPSPDPASLVHGWNSSIGVVNLAIALGWRRIVLCGIDMYDRRYFWLPSGERRADVDDRGDDRQPFGTAEQVIDLYARWQTLLAERGVELLVYNPRSLLAGALDVFTWNDAGRKANARAGAED